MNQERNDRSDETVEDSEHDDGHDVIYTLRTAHQNQTQHLLLADQKANVLIGIVAVILTILFTRTNFLTSSELLVRNIFLLFVLLELLAFFLAILVITPKGVKTHPHASLDEVPNALFFGYFTRFSENDYLEFMQQRLSSSGEARTFLVRDLYQIGVVLKRKYRLLKMAYMATAAGFLFLFVCFVWLAYSDAALA